jgi:outer membrane protein assembly factor BamE (lipoprotein component of BamABCDE complex)
MNLAVKSFALVVSTCTLFACSAGQHRDEVRDDEGDRLTVGAVQREIKVGMSGAEVAAILGSPNIVTTDEERRESWIYDKISSEVAYSRSSGTIVGLLFGSSGGGLGAGSKSAGAAASTQKTLTVVIKFDGDGLVRDFAYHTSSF